MYRISVFCHNHEKYLKKKIKYYRGQGLEFSHISEMNITFITSLDFMTYEHYNEQPLLMLERRINRILYRKIELIGFLDKKDLFFHMGAYENGNVDVHVSSDED